MNLSISLAHLFGIKPAKSAKPVTASKATTQPAGKKPKRKATSSHRSFLELLGPDYIAQATSPHRRERAKSAKPAITQAVMPTAPHQDIPAEIAAKVIAAGEKARGGRPPYFKHEPIGELMQRARTDNSAGIATAILNAGAMGRGEQPNF